MRLLCLILMLSACAHAQHLSPSILGTALSLDVNCNLVAIHKGQSVTYPLNFESVQQCRLVTHSGTNISHTVFINGAYMLFVENNHTKNDNCFSEYTAFNVAENGVVSTTNLIKKSGSCYQDKELMAFEYFSSKLK